ILTGGSSLLNCGAGCTSSSNEGGEFAYGSGISGNNGTNQGVSSSGLGLFGAGNLNGSNLEGPVAVDGPNFSLVNGLSGSANTGITGVPTIDNSVTFTFMNVPASLTLNNITFQYGTALTEPFTECNNCGQGFVPEPSQLGLLIFAMALVGFVHWK